MVLDFLFSHFISDADNDNEEWGKEVFDFGEGETWVCFLGWRTRISDARRLGLLPKKGKVIVYREPNALVNKNPRKARKLFLEVYRDVKKHLNKRVNVFSVSLGNLHGFYIVSRHDVGKFVSLLPGPELGRTIWRSWVLI